MGFLKRFFMREYVILQKEISTRHPNNSELFGCLVLFTRRTDELGPIDRASEEWIWEKENKNIS